ncbi:MAG: hypothetical protein EAZ27_11030 [Cytophagales bacterium]|nr:MAG: hypothetical protein EAZ27_11030 [Cytophagales bacterium]
MFKKIFIFFLFYFYYLTAQNTLFQQNNSEKLFNEANEYYFLEKYSIAYESFFDYSQKFPNELKTIDAQYFIANCALKLNHRNAISMMKNFITVYPEHPKNAFANFDIGTFYFKEKKYDKSVEYLSKVDLTKLDKENKIESNFKLAYSYLNLKNYDKALPVFQRLKSEKNKYQFAANYYIGFIFYKKDQYQYAESHLKKAAENNGYSNFVPSILANCYLKQQKYDTLINYCETILEKNDTKKGFEDLYLLAAEGYYQKNNWSKANDNFENYFATTQSTTDLARFKYGVTSYKIENYNKAIEIFKKTAEKNDTIGQNSAYYLGLTWLQLSNKPYALNAFNQARKMQFNTNVSHQSTLEYAKLNLENERFKDAISACKDYLNNNPNGGIIHNEINDLLGEAYLHTNDFAIAIKHIEGLKFKSGNVNRTFQLVTHFYALQLYNEEKYTEAIDNFQKSLSNDFNRETTVLNNYYLAESYIFLKQSDNAIEYFTKVIRHTAKINPELFARSFYAMGYIYFNKTDYSKALIYFKDYVDEEKNETNKNILNDGYIRFADCQYATKKMGDALKYYDKPIENQAISDIDYCYLQKGIILAATNKNEEAKSKLNIILQNYPNSKYYDDALFNYGLIDFENTNYPSAVTAFTDIINANKSDVYVPLALQKRAIAMYNLKNYELSAQDYQTILNKYPTHKVASSAVLGLQEALNQMGKSEQMDTLLAAYKSQNPNDVNIEKVEFENCKTLYFEQKYNEVITKSNKFIAQHAQSQYLNDLKYFLADSYAKSEDKQTAYKYFEEVFNSGKSNFLNKTILKLSELNFENKDFLSSLNYYKKLENLASNKKELAQSWSGMMQTHFELKNNDSSNYYAKKIISFGAPSVIMNNKSLLFIAKNNLALESNTANDDLIVCLNSASDIHGAEATFLLAQELYDSKKYKNSLELLFMLNKKYSSFPKWIDKSYMQIADNYIMLNELYQAKATLISIIEKAKDLEITNQAKLKLEKLDAQ